MKPESGWPINHTNGDSAAFTTLIDSPGINKSWYVTGFVLTGGGDTDGFSIIRKASIKLAAANNTITFADNAALEPVDGDATIEFGFKTSDVSLVDLISNKTGNPINGYEVDINSSGKLVVTVGDGTDTASITSLNVVNDDKWHHVIVNWDRDSETGLTMHIDGRSAATAVDPTDVDGSCTGNQMIIAGTAAKTVYVSTVGIYKGGILSDTTIASRAGIDGLGNSGACGSKFIGDETNLAFAANLDEGTGTTAACKDLVGSIDGTLANGSWEDGQGLPIDPHTLKKTIQYNTGSLTTYGVVGNTVVTFPHPIKIGRNNPIRIDETDGGFGLQLFGYEDLY